MKLSRLEMFRIVLVVFALLVLSIRGTESEAKPDHAAALSRDGRTAASSTDGKKIELWDLESGTLLRKLLGPASALCFSADGRTVAAGAEGNSVRIFDVASGSLQHVLNGHTGKIWAVAFSPDGRTLASGGEDNTVRIWDTNSSALLFTLTGHTNWVNCVTFSSDGRLLASASDDGTIMIWDASTGHSVRSLNGHTSAVFVVAFSPDGHYLASTSEDNTIKIWEVGSGSLLRTLTDQYVGWSVAFSPDQRLLASSGGDKTIKIWDVNGGALLRTIPSSTNAIVSIVFRPDGRSLAASSTDNKVRIIEFSEEELLAFNNQPKSNVPILPFQNDHSASPGGTSTTTPPAMPARPSTQPAVMPGGVPVAMPVASNAPPILPGEIVFPAYRPDKATGSQTNQSKSPAAPAVQPAENHAPPADAPKPTAAEPASAAEAASATAQAVKDSPVKDKWALVVGISQFKHPEINLKYAAKDAQDFYNFLINEANFRKDHVLLLLNEQATRENIMTAFGDQFLPSVSLEGDLVLVYVSTHGTPKGKDQAGHNYIVAYDTDPTKLFATGVDMDLLNKRIKEGVHTDRALVIMDTCYSGAGVPGARALNAADSFDVNELAQGCGHLVVSSSSPSERSWESKISTNGVFTKYLLETLRQNKKADMRQAFQAVQKKVAWEVLSVYSQKQTPQLGGSWQGKELILAVPATEPRPMLNPTILKMMNARK